LLARIGQEKGWLNNSRLASSDTSRLIHVYNGGMMATAPLLKVQSTHAALISRLMLVALLGLCMLAGCLETPTEKTEKATADSKAEITFVTWKPNLPEIWQEVLRRFHDEHPHIKVHRQIGPHSSTAFHDLLTQKLKNRSAEVDVFLMDVIWPPEFASAGWALALDDRFTREERDEFFPAGIEANTWEGKVYGVPFNIDTGMLFYRRDLLEARGWKPPETWPQLVRQAKAVMAEEKRAGRYFQGYSGQFKQYEGLICDMLEFVLSAGGQIIDPDTGSCLLAEPAALQAVRFVRDEIMGRVAPRGSLMYQEPESLALFVQDRALFLRSWPYAWAVSNDPRKSKVAGKVGIAPLPHFTGNRSHATLGGWQVGISAYSRQPDAAWEFAKFITSRPVQIMFALNGGRAPTRMDLYHDPQVLKAQPHFAAMRESFAGAAPRPRSPLYPALSRLLQVYFSRALSDPKADLKSMAKSTCRQIEGLVALTREAER
jgi:multiple sugar transport system substrate-binding protein